MVGVPDERYGEAVTAFVIPREDATAAKDKEKQKLQDFVREKLSSHLGEPPTTFLVSFFICNGCNSRVMIADMWIISSQVYLLFISHRYISQNSEWQDSEV